MERFLIIGPGRVGTALALAFQNAGHTIVGAIGSHRSRPSSTSHTFGTLLDCPVYPEGAHDTIGSLLAKASVVLFTTGDTTLPTIVADMAIRYASVWSREQLAMHASGALGLATLSPLADLGVQCGTMHPLQPFANPVESARSLPDAYMAIAGDGKALATIRNLVTCLGAKPFVIHEDERVAYHAAATLASNGLVALASTAATLLPSGVGFEALVPLLQGTVNNLRTVGLPNALTGPIDRGDFQTVEAHLRAVQQMDTANQVYRVMARAVAEVAYQKGSLDERQRDDIMQRVKGG